MAKNYQKADYNSSFQGSAAPRGFDPVRAFDNSHIHRQRAEEEVAGYQTLARGAARQAQLDMAAVDVARAQSNANFKAFEGLLALTRTGMNFYEETKKYQEQRQDEDMLLESIGFGEEPAVLTPEEQVEAAQTQVGVEAEATGTAKVAQELNQTGTLNGMSVAHTLQQSTAYKALTGIQGNAYSAAANHGIFLQEALRSLPPDMAPKTAAEAQVLLREINRQYLRGTGMMNAPREHLVRLARQMAGNTQNALGNVVASAIKADQEANLGEAQGFVSNLVDAGGNAQEIWNEASKRYAFGNVGYTGHSAASNQAALENILQEAAENGNTSLINELRNAQQVPGQAGTELGKKYDHIFDKYEKAARQGAISNYNLREQEQAVQTKESIRYYYDNPSPENRQKAIATLRAIGTEDALKEAERLAANGLGYDPQKKFELLEMRQKGLEIDQGQLKALLDAGTISAEEYKMFATSAPETVAAKEVDSYIKEIDSGLKASMLGTAGPQDLTPEVRAQVNIRHQAMVEDLRRLVLAEVKSNPAIAKDPVELTRIVETKTQYLLQQPQYKLTRDPQKGYYFPGEIKADSRLQRITVAPGVQDFSKIKPEEAFGKLKFPKSEMDASKDRFLTIDELKADVKRVMAGQPASNRTRLWAKNMGLSSTAFIEGQLSVNGLPSLRSLRVQESGGAAPNLTDIPNARVGLQVLQQMGFPKLGAAYLAGNIQQESSWHGRREWGQVAGDGTNRNGGLVSWASWSNDSARLGAIERHYGKNIAQISESDQLNYMVLEMKRRNPDAYRTFMNPNATEDQLRKASYQYWGYGHEGARFKYARNLLASGSL